MCAITCKAIKAFYVKKKLICVNTYKNTFALIISSIENVPNMHPYMLNVDVDILNKCIDMSMFHNFEWICVLCVLMVGSMCGLPYNFRYSFCAW